jgi:hypothetical protein
MHTVDNKVSVLRKLKILAWQWGIVSERERKDLVQAAFLIAGGHGLEFLSQHVRIPFDQLWDIGEITYFKKKKNRWRRQRGQNPRKAWLTQEYATMPPQMAGRRKPKQLKEIGRRVPGSFECNFR